MNISAIGVEAKPIGLDETSEKLNKMTGAAARAEAATNGLAEASRGASGAAQAAIQGYTKTGIAAAGASKQIELMHRAANDNSYRLKGVAMQLSQVAQQASATGQWVQALAIQLPDLGLAFGTVGIAVGVVAGALLPLLPVSKMASSVLMAIADNLQMIAPYAVAAAAGLALLYAPQLLGGVISLIALLGRLVVQVGAVATAFLLANPATLFIAGIVAVVAAVGIFRDEITKAIGVDVVDAAKRGANFVIGSFVAAFHDIEFMWKNFPAIIGSAAIGAANAVIQAMANMIQRAAGLVDSFANKANEYLPESLQLGTIGNLGLDKAGFDNPYTAQLQKALADRGAQVEKDLNTNYLGKIGDGIAAGASKGVAALKDLNNWMTRVDEKTKKTRAGKTDEQKYDDIVSSANRRIASLQAEQDALGMTEQAALKLRYEQDLLNEASQRGIVLSADQKASLSGLAERMAEIETATKNYRDALSFAKDGTRGVFDDLRNSLQQGKGLWKSFGDAALGVLDKIVSKINDQLVDAIFSASSAASGGGGFWGSLLGIFGLGSGGSSSTSPSWLNNGFDTSSMAKYANGTSSARSGLAVVGERGPEIVKMRGGEQVIPNHQINATPVTPVSAGGSASTVLAPINVTIDARGADSGAVARIERSVVKLKADLPAQMVATVKDAQRRRVL